MCFHKGDGLEFPVFQEEDRYVDFDIEKGGPT